MNVLILEVENTNRNQYRYAAIELEQDYCDLVAERARVYKQAVGRITRAFEQRETRYNDRTTWWCDHADMFDPKTLDDCGELAEDTLDQGVVVIPAGAFIPWPPSLSGKMVFTESGVHWEIHNESGEPEQTVPVNPSDLVAK